MISKIFFRELLKATEIRGVVLFSVLAEVMKMMINTIPKTIQPIANAVMLNLFLIKKLRYLTLAALTPSFNFPGAYSAINITVANPKRVTTAIIIKIQVMSFVHKQINIIKTIEDPKAISAVKPKRL